NDEICILFRKLTASENKYVPYDKVFEMLSSHIHTILAPGSRGRSSYTVFILYGLI
ncbi:hypothetical protein L9F63_019441, partial [Diploptera punctata]